MESRRDLESIVGREKYSLRFPSENTFVFFGIKNNNVSIVLCKANSSGPCLMGRYAEKNFFVDFKLNRSDKKIVDSMETRPS